MNALPLVESNAVYWADVHQQPLDFWQPALATIAARHGLPADTWARARLGRNVVFLGAAYVAKLGPPCWPGEMGREIAALRHVAGRVPVNTPTLHATGMLNGWEYMVQERLTGTNLWELWPQLPAAARAALVHQHGTLMAAIHAIPLAGADDVLRHDWQHMLAEQRAECEPAMREAGVAPALVAQIAAYLAATPWHADDAPVLLHGDLSHVNFLVNEIAGTWRITSVIDWGDVKIGPRTHELISPGVHMYRGDAAALAHWYRGYGWDGAARTATREHIATARAMLYYADDMARLLGSVPGAAACATWHAVAQALWRFGG